MKFYNCKICSGGCQYNKRFTEFLALGSTQCRVFSCRRCNTGFLVGDVPHNIYSDEYFSVSGDEYSYEDQSASNAEHYRSISKNLASLSDGDGAIADIGCGLGHFMVIASVYFQKVDGFDGFIDPTKFVASRDQLTLCDLDGLELDENKYDSIALNHSLEHVNEPIKLLAQVFKGLRKGGVAYIEVPYQFGSFYDKVNFVMNPKKFPDFLSFHHKTFFNPSSLVFALKKEGFKILKVSTFLPERGADRFRGIKGKLLYLFLCFSSVFKRADYIAVYAKKE